MPRILLESAEDAVFYAANLSFAPTSASDSYDVVHAHRRLCNCHILALPLRDAPESMLAASLFGSLETLCFVTCDKKARIPLIVSVERPFLGSGW